MKTPAKAPGQRSSPLRSVRPEQAVQKAPSHPSNQAIQAKLRVNQPGDEYEREADRVADQVTRGEAGALAAAGAPGISRLQRVPEAAQEAAARSPGEEEEKKQRLEMIDKVQEEEKAAQQKQVEAPQEQKEEEKQEEEKKKEDEQATVQTKPLPGRIPEVTPGITGRLEAARGGGRPLPEPLRSSLEPRFGRDLSGVRLHTDDRAAGLARDLDAQAFTHGRDVFFGAGRYQPESPSGRWLLAHELTHTVQQDPGPPVSAAAPAPSTAAATPDAAATPAVSSVQRQVIQRDETGTGAGSSPPPAAAQGQSAVDPTTLPLETGQLDPTTETITFAEIPVPVFKRADHRGPLYNGRSLRQKKGYQRGEPDQRAEWKAGVGQNTTTAVSTLTEKVRAARAQQAVDPGASHVLKAPSRFGMQQPRYFIGTLTSVAQEMTLPSWDRQGQGHSYDVDHVVELQLANWETEGWANTLENMELLDSSANRSSGSTIKNNIDAKLNSFIRVTHEQYGRSPAALKQRYHIAFEQAVDGGGQGQLAAGVDFWTRAQIEAGEHLAPVQAADLSELGREGEVVVFPDAGGGVRKTFRWPGGLGDERDWLKPFVLTAKQFDTSEAAQASPVLGSLSFNVPANDPHWHPFEGGDEPIPVQRIPGARYAGYINKNTVRDKLRGLRHRKASPIQLDGFDVLPDGGVLAEGRIMPELPLLRGSSINFAIRGRDLQIYKEFGLGDLTVPRPFQVRESSLTVSLGTESGLGVSGRVDFGIERVGEGYIAAGVSTSQPFNLEGRFNFDSSLFDPAAVTVRYQDGAISAEGELGIPQGKIRGIKSANFRISYAEADGRLAATGSAELEVPGLRRASIAASFSEAEGMMLGGSVELADNIPGLRGGSVMVEVRKPPGEEAYKVKATGTATPAIPGVDSTVTVSYDDGAFDANVRAAYRRGMLSGSVQVGATNRAVDAEGNPAGDPTDQVFAYGGGTVTARLTPWLEGTVGLRLLPNGELEVTGSIALPSAIDLFPERSYERNLFSIGIDIPIVGVAVAGQRVGIFATIRGGLDLSAGVGPGQLRDLHLSVTYNPDHEEDTHIEGGAQLHIPAHAGLRLFVRGGLGAGIPLVSATAALEVGGQLGLEGAVQAGVQVDWTPTQGLVLDALGEIFVEPKFRFDVTGMVLVEADLLVDTIELYSQRWQLAQFEYGSGLRFGVRLPIHYQEGQAFDLSWDQVEFVTPDIDPQALLSGLIDRLA